MRDFDSAIDRLTTIRQLLCEARQMADDDHEHMLAAKLDDCVICTDERIVVAKG